MHKITESVTTTSNLNELLSAINQSLKKVVYAENFYVALYDPSTELFSFPYYIDEFSSTPEPNPMLKRCARYVYRKGKSMLRTKELFAQLVVQKEVESGNPDPKSRVGIPLHSPTNIIGVLVLLHYEEENIYSERDINFLDTIGSQIALVIERKLAEEKLKISESRLADAQRLGKLGTLDWDLKTNEIELSDETMRIYGFKKSNKKIQIKEIVKAVHPEDIDRTQKSLMNALKGKAEHNLEHRIIRSDGKVVYLHAMAKLFRDSNNKPVRLLGTNLDITESKLAEQEIQQKNEELQKLNSVKDKFYSIIAHDLRSPFNSLIGFSDILLHDSQSLSESQLIKMYSHINTTSISTFNLLENLLEWSRSMTEMIVLSPENYDIINIINECVTVLRAGAEKKRIKLVTRE